MNTGAAAAPSSTTSTRTRLVWRLTFPPAVLAFLCLLSLRIANGFRPAASSTILRQLQQGITTNNNNNNNRIPADSSSSSSSSTTALFVLNNKKKKKKEKIQMKDSSSTRVRFLNRLGFRRISKDNYEVNHVETKRKNPKAEYDVATLEELDDYFDDGRRRFRADDGRIDYEDLLKSLSVRGDTQAIGSPDRPDYTHPVARVLHERRRRNSKPTAAAAATTDENSKLRRRRPDDNCRVALAIEGGGMRGCISAGMVCAVHHLNLTDAFDVVYGSSAGTIVGSYLITGQLPWFGPEVYYDSLTTAGKRFIDTGRLLRAIGFGLLDPRLLKDVLTRPGHGKPVLNLAYLLNTTLQQTKPLDWDKFVEKQKDQPLKVIASGCKSEKAVVLDYESKSFESLSELGECMHASCLLPGIAGPLMNLDKDALQDPSKKKYVLGNHLKGDNYEPLADALLFEPLPYRSAIEEGATHVVVIRSRPDGTDVTGKGGIFERLIFRRFFLRKNRLPRMFARLKKQLHKKLYAEDIIRLNDEADTGRDYMDTSEPHLMALALPPGSEEIGRLETGREAIFAGLRRGFARAYDALVEDPAERGRGTIVAKEYFPDEILDYDPMEISKPDESAFSIYMREQGISPKAWTDDDASEAAASSPRAQETAAQLRT